MNQLSANVERFSGFADLYDRCRPSPPVILAEILQRLAGAGFPRLVVDLGSGTGLSTRYWAEKAEHVIGIEPSDDMRHQAEARTQSSNITYRSGYSHATGLPDACTQIVACSQALHWMEPQPTCEEVRRILQPGGVFAAFDYDWPPTTGCWQADAAYNLCIQQARQIEKNLPDLGLKQWEKSQHLSRMQISGCFRFTKEIVLHHTDLGNAERLVGLALSQGGIQTLLKNHYTEAEIGIESLRQTTEDVLEAQPRIWYWSCHVRIGVV